MLGPKLNSSCC